MRVGDERRPRPRCCGHSVGREARDQVGGDRRGSGGRPEASRRHAATRWRQTWTRSRVATRVRRPAQSSIAPSSGDPSAVRAAAAAVGPRAAHRSRRRSGPSVPGAGHQRDRHARVPAPPCRGDPRAADEQPPARRPRRPTIAAATASPASATASTSGAKWAMAFDRAIGARGVGRPGRRGRRSAAPRQPRARSAAPRPSAARRTARSPSRPIQNAPPSSPSR